MTTVPLLTRRSPIRYGIAVVEAESRDGWDVALALEDEGDGPWLVDLSHRARWDYQDRDVGAHRPFDLAVPELPGQAAVIGDLVISRMNGTQVAIGHVGAGVPPTTPPDIGFTETTDSHAWLALVGDDTTAALERVTDLDLFPPGVETPRLTQGPILHVPAQIIVCASDCALLAISRGYGQGFVDAFLDSTKDIDVRPGGEKKFTDWMVGSGRIL